MKKTLFLILLPLSFNIYAEDTFRFNFNIAATGFGINYSSESDDNIELFVELLSVGMKHEITNIGIGFSPLKYWIFSFGDELNLENDRQKLSFLNFNVNWNILYNKKLFFGPFCSINYMFLENAELKKNEYIFTGGVRFSWSFNIFNADLINHFIGTEIGYRNINGVNKVHFNINIDLVTFLYWIAAYSGIEHHLLNN